jgi:hypothetical protein
MEKYIHSFMADGEPLFPRERTILATPRGMKVGYDCYRDHHPAGIKASTTAPAPLRL